MGAQKFAGRVDSPARLAPPPRSRHEPHPPPPRPRIVEALESRIVPAVFTVNSFADLLSPPAGTVTLRSAIQAANTTPGPNTINLPFAGTYKITTLGAAADNAAGEFAFTGTSNLTIANTSGGPVTIDGGGGNRVFDVNPAASAKTFTVTFQNLVITHGSVVAVGVRGGAAIDAQGGASVVLSGSSVVRNYSRYSGGGISMEAGSTGSLTVLGSQITGNTALASGAGIAAAGSGPVTISGTVISDNTAGDWGGGIYLAGPSLSAAGVVVRDNTAISHDGGGLYNGGMAAVSLAGDVIEQNHTGVTGGGIAIAAGAGLTTVSRCFVLDNTAAGTGGGIEAGVAINLTDSTVGGNVAQGSGGGLDLGAGITAQLTDCAITENVSSGDGGGIEDGAATFVITGSTIRANVALGNGGGIAVAAGTATVTSCLFQDNAVGPTENGGGIFRGGGALNLNVEGSQFTGNSAEFGGGLCTTNGGVTATDSTFEGNRAEYGGAISVYRGGTLANDTIAFNTAVAGGGIEVDGDATAQTLTLLDDTIDGNTAGSGGGVYHLMITVRAEDTIIARNTAATGPDYELQSGTVTDAGGNLLGSTSGDGGGFGTGTIVADPKLAPLVDNGGHLAGAPADSQIIPTQALLPGSPAYGKGIAGTGIPTTDERGFARRPSPSIGAYEPLYSNTAPANPLFVDVLYEVLFNHPVDPAGLIACTNFLNNGGSPTALIQILQSSNEYLDDEVAQLFHRYLDRAPTSPEFSSFSTALKSGATPEQVAAVLVGSNEFFQDYGGNNDGFVLAAYQTTLGRAAAPSEVAGWDQVLAGGMPRSNVAGLFLSSQEYLTDLIVDDFEAYLGRDPSPSDLSAFLARPRPGSPAQRLPRSPWPDPTPRAPSDRYDRAPHSIAEDLLAGRPGRVHDQVTSLQWARKNSPGESTHRPGLPLPPGAAMSCIPRRCALGPSRRWNRESSRPSSPSTASPTSSARPRAPSPSARQSRPRTRRPPPTSSISHSPAPTRSRQSVRARTTRPVSLRSPTRAT